MLTLTDDEKRFIEAYRTQRDKGKLSTDSETSEWFERYWRKVVPSRKRANYLMADARLEIEACKGCRHIMMAGGHPCMSCKRGKKDLYVAVADEDI